MAKKKDKFLGAHDKSHYKLDRPCLSHLPTKKEQLYRLFGLEDLLKRKEA